MGFVEHRKTFFFHVFHGHQEKKIESQSGERMEHND